MTGSGRWCRDPLSRRGTERIKYDANGNIFKRIQSEQYDRITDDGAGYAYDYDCVNRLVQIMVSDSVVVKRYVYDVHGNIIKEMDREGYASADNDEDRIGTLYQYNTIGNLTTQRYMTGNGLCMMLYDFRMTLDEMLSYIEQEALPERFGAYDNDMRNYALVANGITYMQRIGNGAGYGEPANVSTVAGFLQLMLDRGIFVDLLSDKEVCDMTMVQFSRDEITQDHTGSPLRKL